MDAVLGYTAITFASGGMSDWVPTYISREANVSEGTAGFAAVRITLEILFSYKKCRSMFLL
jgi:hypothetical protein